MRSHIRDGSVSDSIGMIVMVLRYATDSEMATQEHQQRERLKAYLRSLGIDPDQL